MALITGAGRRFLVVVSGIVKAYENQVPPKTMGNISGWGVCHLSAGLSPHSLYSDPEMGERRTQLRHLSEASDCGLLSLQADVAGRRSIDRHAVSHRAS